MSIQTEFLRLDDAGTPDGALKYYKSFHVRMEAVDSVCVVDDDYATQMHATKEKGTVNE